MEIILKLYTSETIYDITIWARMCSGLSAGRQTWTYFVTEIAEYGSFLRLSEIKEIRVRERAWRGGDVTWNNVHFNIWQSRHFSDKN
jgi:hypothetical protein